MNVANIYTKPRRTSLQNFNNTGEILIGHKVYVLPFGHKIDLIQQPLVPLFDPISFFCNETNQIKKRKARLHCLLQTCGERYTCMWKHAF